MCVVSSNALAAHLVLWRVTHGFLNCTTGFYLINLENGSSDFFINPNDPFFPAIPQRSKEHAEIVKQKLDDLVQANATRLATNKTVATEVGEFGFGARPIDFSCFRFGSSCISSRDPRAVRRMFLHALPPTFEKLQFFN